MDAASELEELCNDSSVNVSLELLADGTFEIRYGNDLRHIDLHGHAESFEQAVALLKQAVESEHPPRAG